MSNSLRPCGLQPSRLLCPWTSSPGTNAGMGNHSLLQGIFLTQGWNPALLHLPTFVSVTPGNLLLLDMQLFPFSTSTYFGYQWNETMSMKISSLPFHTEPCYLDNALEPPTPWSKGEPQLFNKSLRWPSCLHNHIGSPISAHGRVDNYWNSSPGFLCAFVTGQF